MRILEKKLPSYECMTAYNQFSDIEKREILNEIKDAIYLSSTAPLYNVMRGRRDVQLREAIAIEQVFTRRGVPANEVWRKL